MTPALRARLYPEAPAPAAPAALTERPADWFEQNLSARWVG
jgi:hypothetical protein